MRSRVGFIKNRIAANLGGSGTDVTVCWTVFVGASAMDPTTGASDGTPTLLSGTLKAFGLEEPGTTVQRTFQEIQAGDLILDMASEPVVTLFPGQMQSGVVRLEDLSEQGTRFVWGGKKFAQQKLGQDLAAAWDAIVANQALHKTILLRKAV